MNSDSSSSDSGSDFECESCKSSPRSSSEKEKELERLKDDIIDQKNTNEMLKMFLQVKERIDQLTQDEQEVKSNEESNDSETIISQIKRLEKRVEKLELNLVKTKISIFARDRLFNQKPPDPWYLQLTEFLSEPPVFLFTVAFACLFFVAGLKKVMIDK